MITRVTEPADLGVLDASEQLALGALSSRELVESCLTRIRERDGVHGRDGDPSSINAWVRVYEESARASAARADELRAAGDVSPLCGVPVGLKDIYAVAGLPLTASSTLLDARPEHDCTVWLRLSAAGMVLLGHLHTHEFAAGGTTDQVGNPWALDRSAGGSSGGSAAALAARMVPAATGTDTAGSLRIPSAFCGTSTIKPTRGLVPLDGVVPLAQTLDHAGPMARSLGDCKPLLAAMAAVEPPVDPAPARRIALSPRIGLVDLDLDVAAGLDAALAACRSAGFELVDVPVPDAALDLGLDMLDALCTEMLVYHRRFDDAREGYRPSTRGFLEYGERRAMTVDEYAAVQRSRRAVTTAWLAWFAEHRVDAVLEPTVPIVARERGRGYDEAFNDAAEISLTHYWDWTGFPVVSLPAGVGRRSGLPVGVSLVGTAQADWSLLEAGIALQAVLGTVSP
jgi:aspartyl-tRNA(Asn)/glutamyl-tRNA(Gln) amidotransferase subunit A